MTGDLVERMVGHRTRLAQEERERWNEGEDQELAGYLESSRMLDHASVLLQTMPRGWLLVGLVALAPALVAGGHSAAALAVGLGGVVLGYKALSGLANGLEKLAGAAIAWQQVKQFWEAAARPEPIGHPAFANGVGNHLTTPIPPSAKVSGIPVPQVGKPLLDAHDLFFRHPGRGEPVLQGARLQVRVADRLLLEGPSGGGKSTLASLLAGSRVPHAGLLLLGGLDRDTIGAEAWRRRVALAPQFHDNHVLAGTFAFNLLMGRRWPPHTEDLKEAERLCRALGLSPLLERMPAAMQQIVGETGWQLSHGEKSRLFLARALLQGADLAILDESLAALDPETLRRCLQVVLDEAPTTLVIAHP
jgi:ATP-binding cassette subfamily B protein